MLELLHILLGEFYAKLDNLQEMVPRDIKFPEAPNKIKVAIGMRRVGKTYLIYQHIIKLLSEGIDKRSILYINFEDDRLLPLDQQKLAKLVEAFFSLYPENHDRKCYLFLDEIQNVDQWPLVIRRFHDTKNCEIFLTGSSAKLLSKEIATSLRGRSIATEVWPFSFQEFLRAKKIPIATGIYGKKRQDQQHALFQNYLIEGGFPKVISYSVDVRQQTLQDYLDIVIYRDIIERHQIKHPTLIKFMILSMMHTVSRPFAIHKFFNDAKSQGYSVGKDTLYTYADHIEDAYLAFSVDLYSESIRKVHSNPKKLYAIDTGITKALTINYDLGKLFENAIYLELRRRGCKVNYFLTQERYEIDFVATSPMGTKKMFQVAWNTEQQSTLAREERALQAGMQELKIEGEIITLDSYLQHGILFP